MDISKLTVTQMTACANAFRTIEEVMQDDLPAGFGKMLDEYIEMDTEARSALLNELNTKANFLAYAEIIGAPEIADALQKVAFDMAKMDDADLKTVASGGVTELAKMTVKAEAEQKE